MSKKTQRLHLRNLGTADYEDLVAVTQASYSNIGGYWRREQIERLIDLFPDGQLAIEHGGKVVAFALAIIVDYSRFGDDHDYASITGNYSFNTHDPSGDVLYGIEICVHPEARALRLGRRLYDARKELCEKLNLRAIVAGGRMPNYANYAETLKPREYIRKVKNRTIYDPVLSFQLSNEFRVKKVLTDYLPQDTESKAYATLIEWNNIYHAPHTKGVRDKRTYARIGVVQWQMRNVSDLRSLFEYVEFFVDSVSSYDADFVLLPEFINFPMMLQYNHLDPAGAVREIARYTEEIRQKFSEFALSYNINIIAGSLPIIEDEKLYNISYLLRRDGTWDAQYKIHITPSEREEWGIVGGNTIKAFDTDVCKIGILICYDSEFPELSRILAEQGMKILFVPFSTDMNSGYQRVRICSRARAIENECYVAIAGSVGNLPRVKNMDLQYAQSAVFSPSDIFFPTDGVVREGVPNTEMVIIADVDLNDLKELHTRGSVRTLLDRRTDLYQVRFNHKVVS